jgi:hypothetical protein
MEGPEPAALAAGPEPTTDYLLPTIDYRLPTID